MDYQRRLRNWIVGHPVLAPVVVGAALRVIAAFSGIGIFASDDYFHVIEPAERWLHDSQIAYHSSIRSEFFPRIVWLLMWTIRGLGIDDIVRILQCTYAALGLISVAAIPAAYRLGCRMGDEQTGRAAAWLVATFALLPRLSTRALIGIAASTPALWALVWAERMNSSHDRTRRDSLLVGLAAGGLFGLSALVRFQAGLLYVGVGLFLLYEIVRKRLNLCAPDVIGFVIGGLMAAVAQISIDHAMGRPAFGTMDNYLSFNFAESPNFGTAHWGTYWGMLLLLTAPPVTWVLASPMWRAARAVPRTTAAILFFVLVHSFIPHKEDRFMFLIIPAFVTFIAAGLVEAWKHGAWSRKAAKFYLVLNLIGLIVVTASDGQRSTTIPLREVGRDSKARNLAAVGFSLIPRLYVDRRVYVHTFNGTEEFTESMREGLIPDYILYRHPDQIDPSAWNPEGRRAKAVHCEEPVLYHGDLIDQAIVWVNPEFNRRRMATALVRCGLRTAK